MAKNKQDSPATTITTGFELKALTTPELLRKKNELISSIERHHYLLNYPGVTRVCAEADETLLTLIQIDKTNLAIVLMAINFSLEYPHIIDLHV
jgi:hypothetical protein